MAVTRGEGRRGTRVTLIGIHTNEGNNPPGDQGRDRTAENLAAWLDREIAAKRYKSYTAIGDDDSIAEHCPESLASWSMRSGNLRSLNYCFTGWASWTRAQWLEHPQMLLNAAGWVRHKCVKYQIPMVRVTGQEIRAGRPGICGHGDWSDSNLDSSDHTDPGRNFPWDYFIALVRGEDDDMATPAEIWGHLLDDPYVSPDGKKATQKNAADLLRWAATHAAYAKEQAITARAEVAALRVLVTELASEADIDVDRMVQLMDERFREALKDGLLEVTVTVNDETEGADKP